MKAVTEFAVFTLNQGLKAKAALTAEGKSPEEIQASLGTTFKLEGDKLNYFINALDVAGQNTDSLKRVLVISVNEGETAPNKATKVDELYYSPEFFVAAKPQAASAAPGKGGRGGGGRRNDGPKGSPWGMSPEELANKNKKQPVKPS